LRAITIKFGAGMYEHSENKKPQRTRAGGDNEKLRHQVHHPHRGFAGVGFGADPHAADADIRALELVGGLGHGWDIHPHFRPQPRAGGAENAGYPRGALQLQRARETQPWDKWLSPLVAFGSVFILLVAGLDALFHWSAGFSLPVEIAGLALIVFGYVLASYAFVENAYFSGTVRIQEERGHKVVSSGPYGWVRHPGYLGNLIASLGMPLLLDSTWAFIPVVIFGAVFFLRTSLEDRFLQGNLPGYREYAQKVHYRLVPGIW